MTSKAGGTASKRGGRGMAMTGGGGCSRSGSTKSIRVTGRAGAVIGAGAAVGTGAAGRGGATTGPMLATATAADRRGTAASGSVEGELAGEGTAACRASVAR